LIFHSKYLFRLVEFDDRIPSHIALPPRDSLMREADSRDLSDSIWDFVLALDALPPCSSPHGSGSLRTFHSQRLNGGGTIITCDRCGGIIEFGHISAILPCSHTFHVDCMENELNPSCFVCSGTNRKKKQNTPTTNAKSNSKKALEVEEVTHSKDSRELRPRKSKQTVPVSQPDNSNRKQSKASNKSIDQSDKDYDSKRSKKRKRTKGTKH
jgi:hypothetical protein